MFVVYAIRGPKGVYIGQTRNFERRQKGHLHLARTSAHPRRRYIHNAIAKHGVEHFSFERICSALTHADVLECEKQIIAQEAKAGQHLYNLTPGGEGWPPGKPFSPEHIEKLRKASTGRKCSEASRQKISQRHKNKSLSLEHKAKLAIAHLGKKLSRQHRINIKQALQGRKHNGPPVYARALSKGPAAHKKFHQTRTLNCVTKKLTQRILQLHTKGSN